MPRSVSRVIQGWRASPEPWITNRMAWSAKGSKNSNRVTILLPSSVAGCLHRSLSAALKYGDATMRVPECTLNAPFLQITGPTGLRCSHGNDQSCLRLNRHHRVRWSVGHRQDGWRWSLCRPSWWLSRQGEWWKRWWGIKKLEFEEQGDEEKI